MSWLPTFALRYMSDGVHKLKDFLVVCTLSLGRNKKFSSVSLLARHSGGANIYILRQGFCMKILR